MSEIKSGCDYRVLENGIHEFVILDFSRAGVDAFYEAVLQMNTVIPAGLPRPILVDSSGGVLPLSYAFSRLRSLPAGTAASQEQSKTALILQPGMMVSIIAGMLRIFPLLSVRFYKPGERQAALDWLTQK